MGSNVETMQALAERIEIGACFHHLNTGERWTVVAKRDNGQIGIALALRSRWVWPDYLLDPTAWRSL